MLLLSTITSLSLTYFCILEKQLLPCNFISHQGWVAKNRDAPSEKLISNKMTIRQKKYEAIGSINWSSRFSMAWYHLGEYDLDPSFTCKSFECFRSELSILPFYTVLVPSSDEEESYSLQETVNEVRMNETSMRIEYEPHFSVEYLSK